MNETTDATTQTTVDTPITTLAALIDAQRGAALPTDDVLVLVLPLFEQVAQLHAQGRVAALAPTAVVLGADGGLHLRQAEGQPQRLNIDAVHRVQPLPASTLNIVGELRRSHDTQGWEELSNLEVQENAEATIERPVYLPGYASWELALGHHDEIADIFRLGLLLAALACCWRRWPAAWTSMTWTT